MFIQVIKGKVADAEGLKAAVERWRDELAPGAEGWLGSTGGLAADGTAIEVVRFESEDAARRNSERPEQGQWWAEASKFFDGDVAFNDCSEVLTIGAGGSDEAGFVQVIQGRASDPDRARGLMGEADDAMRTLRPDVLGGVVALHNAGDGGFTQVIYFTSEAAAREGEAKEPPAEMKAQMEEMASLFSDMTYYDLSRPWLMGP